MTSKSFNAPRAAALLLAVAGAATLSYQAMNTKNMTAETLLAQTPAQAAETANTQLSTGPIAPEFPAGFSWINTDKPLSLRALRGKVVLLDFWTYGCINCMHVLPDLKKLERKYTNELVIIGVHSAKFANESDAQNIKNVVMRYNIEHPVIVDQDMKIWDSFGVNSWPTFVLIAPDGRVVGSAAGEGQYDLLDKTIARTASRFRAAGKLDETPLKFALASAQEAPSALRFPGKVLADAASNRLFIADTNQNRIVISDLNGKVESVAGSGRIGFNNGAFANATFHNPQGMALSADGGTLYVADTDNHAIRALNLKTKTVTTIAGTGKQAAWRSGGGVGTQAALSSPWALNRIDDTLYIAMAGPHQIWKMDLDSKKVGVFAGSGQEARIDGAAVQAALAQPSGLATDGKKLFFADSESSSIRAVDLPNAGVSTPRVSTLVGGGGVESLFSFGDKDGSGASTRLQHPLGVAYDGGVIYVADTYNHKIKVIDVARNSISTLAGGARGDKDGSFADAQFYEPGGLSISGGKLYVADTNNNAIRVLDLASKTVSTLNVQGAPNALAPEAPRGETADVKTVASTRDTVLAPGAATLQLSIQLPAKHHLNEESPQRIVLKTEGGATLSTTTIKGQAVQLRTTVPLKVPASGAGAVNIDATIFYCLEGKNAVCKLKSVKTRVPFVVGSGGAKTLTVPLVVKD